MLSWPSALVITAIIGLFGLYAWLGSRPAPVDTTKLVELINLIVDLNRRLDAITADLRAVNNGQERQ